MHLNQSISGLSLVNFKNKTVKVITVAVKERMSDLSKGKNFQAVIFMQEMLLRCQWIDNSVLGS